MWKQARKGRTGTTKEDAREEAVCKVWESPETDEHHTVFTQISVVALINKLKALSNCSAN